MDPCHGVSFEDASLPAHSGLCARVMAIEQGSSLAGSLVIGDYVTHAGEHQIESAAGLGRLLAGEITEHSESVLVDLEARSSEHVLVLKILRRRYGEVVLTKQRVTGTRLGRSFGLQIGTPVGAPRTAWGGRPCYVLVVEQCGAGAGLVSAGCRVDAFDGEELMSPGNLARFMREEVSTGCVVRLSLNFDHGCLLPLLDQMTDVHDL
eukprot:CAMPEP_0181199146 /NCGR_PEP_ID=MMETSP1096-20121128/17016_1 /TAXON_ID=156174 ORGANISM="Chrysochromulina ericina, Strain CCMP281" /NCGR_SAMPLE_ID=MMETSP1096 /ASSEMBLY_ACC=CAM_ASM_000453 /LENGTH=206 /DNA_ID=CAMNT_0023289299 /DNA_START=115 /DNA_END=735 /DNA_ORIENTATION=-